MNAPAARWKSASSTAQRGCARIWNWTAAWRLRSFEAIEALRRDYAWAIDVEVCVFPQEGLTNNPRSDALLVEAFEARRRR